MARVTVTINLPNVTAKEIDEDIFRFDNDGKFIVDEAYLTRFKDDDSFYVFDFEGVEDAAT